MSQSAFRLSITKSRSDLRTELLHETIDVLAARRGLVPVKKMLPMDGITPQEAHLIHSVEQPEFRQPGGYYHGIVGTEDGPSEPAEWIEEGTMIVIKYQPDKFFPLESKDVFRFVPVDRLTPEHLPSIEGFLERSEPNLDPYSIEDPEEVRLVAETLEDLGRL